MGSDQVAAKSQRIHFISPTFSFFIDVNQSKVDVYNNIVYVWC